MQRFDRRVQAFDLPAVESLTRDPLSRTVDKTLAVDAFVTWRIPDAAAVDRFVRSVGTAEQARKVLGPRINGRLAAVVSTIPLDELAGVTDSAAGVAGVVGPRRGRRGRGSTPRTSGSSTSAATASADDCSARRGPTADAGDRIKERAAEYGIEVVQLRVRRFGYPEAVRASIAERIRSERRRKVADYESEGRRRAADIATDADREARSTECRAKAQKKAHGGAGQEGGHRRVERGPRQGPEFYVFLQTLKAYQTMLADTKDVLLLSTRHPLFDLLLKPPQAADAKK